MVANIWFLKFQVKEIRASDIARAHKPTLTEYCKCSLPLKKLWKVLSFLNVNLSGQDPNHPIYTY